MTQYIARRILQIIPLLLGVSVVVFLGMQVIPGDAASAMAGQGVTAAEIQHARHALHLDQPLPVQYWYFLSGAVHLDFGSSLRTHDSVFADIRQALPTTIQLTIAALLLAIMIGMSLGILAATQRGKIVDTLAMSVVLVGVSMPVFWSGVLLLIYFGATLGWFPIGGSLDNSISLRTMTGMTVVDSLLTWNMAALASSLSHLVLPAFTLSLFPAASIARMTRTTMVESLRQDYVRTARAKGLSRRVVVWKHALRNALIPVVTIIGLQLGLLLSGAVLTESVFALPGIGRLIVTSIQARDYPMVQGIVLIAACLFVFVNLCVDILYVYLNPRIKYD
jgi:peptide/nickel transport system permease protein